jgi:hypothetical protein
MTGQIALRRKAKAKTGRHGMAIGDHERGALVLSKRSPPAGTGDPAPAGARQVSTSGGTAAHGEDTLIDPAPLKESGRNWTRFAGPVISLAILVAVLWQLRTLDLGKIVAMIPLNPLFWLVFISAYMALPASELLIFRRLWAMPFSGIGALLRKLVSNEILLGYLGEVYFYAWARRHARAVAAPFGAIKDVTILSALTGNAATFAMVLLALPWFHNLRLGVDSTAFAYSMAFMLGTSTLLLLFRKTLFTLPKADLWFITFVHFARIFGAALLTGVMWHLLLPDVSVIYWLLLATMRQLLSRLPFLPNKDVIFVGLASFMVGRDTEIVTAMAVIATLFVSAHLVVGVTLGLSGLIREKTS